MSKINILDKFISNRISAGEVVERPFSVVKELVENSIDANADKIVISVEEGGIKSISILDNGSGIEKDDIKLAFMPHATSKIKCVEDLDNIFTLGFRGEALASISSVAQVEIMSKTQNDELGTTLKVEGGQFGELSEIAMNTGTKITVNNLFYNTPARRKFLRKSKTEEGEITDLVEKLILANPNVQFRYIIDGKIKYDTTGSGLYSNIYTIYGKDTIDNILEVNAEREGYRLWGYVGKPEISKANRTYQTLIVNGRIVKNSFISNAIQEVYQNFLMKNKFPFFVLCLSLPFDCVDVNVHPSKMEIKFENLGFIRTLFTNSVYSALMNANFTRIAESEKQQDLKIENNAVLHKIDAEQGVSYDNSKTNSFQEISLQSEPEFEKESNMFLNSNDNNWKQKLEANSEESRLTEYILNSKKNNSYVASQYQESIDDNLPKAKIIGVIFKTYILVEKDDCLYMIDQHASHERTLYDKYLESVKKNEVIKQNLLVSKVLNLNSLEFDFIKRNYDCLEDIGFDLEFLGNNSIKITAIPYMLEIAKIDEFFDYFMSNLQDYTEKGKDFFKTDLMQHSCKMAVKSGQILSLNEIEKLIDELDKHILLCPHGRPIVVKIDKKQIEKWFKRVL